MKAMRLASRLAATATFILIFLPASFHPAAAAPPPDNPVSIPTGQIASVDPHVPRASGQPCVVELFNDRPWPQDYVYIVNDPTISYTPPAACPPPWSKIILKLDIQSIRRSVVDTLGMDLANVRLFRQAVPRYGGATNGSPVNWHVERDLTDYSALFKLPQSGQLWSTQNYDAVDFIVDSFAFNASAKLVFYPATATTPAPRVPDAVIAANQGPINLPHNIERAYLDVENDYPGNAFWYTCVSNDTGNLTLDDIFAPGGNPYDTSIYPPRQGCGGGNFQEIHIGVDGTPAGISPAFPLIVADLNWSLQNSADEPITTLEMLNFKPYRVDLTPFAAILSAAGAHNVTADNDDAGGGGATLLLYLDPHSSQVSGAVTLNTLATENGAATDTDTLKQTGETNRGDIKTQEHRNFEIRGFVYTSHGRIDSRVQQTSEFKSTQAFHLAGPPFPPYGGVPYKKLYDQDIWLTDSVQQTSSRAVGPRLISLDRTSVQYPLHMIYSIATTVIDAGGWNTEYRRTNVTVEQERVVDGDHYQWGHGYFSSHTDSHFYSVRKGGDQQPDPRSMSSTTRDYRDSFGSCYRAEMTSDNGTITGLSKGEGCRDGHNWVVWFAHPDGSPDSFDWEH